MKKISRIILLIAICIFFYGVSIGMNFTILPLLYEDNLLSKKQIGILLAFDITSTLFSAILLPKIIARIGLFKLILYASIIRNLSLVLFPFFNQFYIWSIIAMIFGFSGGFLFLSFQLWVNNIVEDKYRATALGSLNAAISLGIAIGPFMLELTSLRGFVPFIISSIICSILCIPLFAMRKLMNTNFNAVKSLPFIKVIKKSPFPIISGILVDYIYFSLSGFIVLYGILCGLEDIKAKFLISILLFGTIILEIPVGYISDRVNRRLLIYISVLLILIVSQFFEFAVKNFIFASVIFGILCGSMGGVYTSALAILGEKFKGENMTSANSTFALMNSIGGMFGVITTGFLMDRMGKEGFVVSISSACIIFLVINVFYFKIKQITKLKRK